MTPADFINVRKRLGMKREMLAAVIGVEESTVRGYERGIRRVPGDIEQTLLRITGKTNLPCPKCGTLILVEWHDGPCCGRCTQPLPEDL
jgi:DNA-binding XRE family transcriptional regulator